MAKAIAIGALAILLLLPVSARSDEAAAKACSKAPGFSLDEPEGWTCERKTGEEAIEVELRPTPRSAAPGELAIDVALVKGRVVPADAVHRALAHRTVPDGPADVQPFDAAHPTLPTAGGAVELSRGEVYAVAVQADRGAGAYFVALFTKTSGPATAEELALFRRTIASLRYPSRSTR